MVWDRAERYGDWRGEIGENVQYGSKTGREVLVSLIIDDGVPDRGHRESLFKADFGVMGVACGPHAACDTMGVIVLAEGYEEGGE